MILPLAALFRICVSLITAGYHTLKHKMMCNVQWYLRLTMYVMHVVMRVMRRWVAECSDTCLTTRAVNAQFDVRCDAAKDGGSEPYTFR